MLWQTKYWKSQLYICTEEHTAELDLLAQNPIINPQIHLNAACNYCNSQKQELENV